MVNFSGYPDNHKHRLINGSRISFYDCVTRGMVPCGISMHRFLQEIRRGYLDYTQMFRLLTKGNTGNDLSQPGFVLQTVVSIQVLYSAHILPKRLPPLPSWDFPSSAPIPSCIAVFTGFIGVES